MRLTTLEPQWINVQDCPFRMLVFICPICPDGHSVGVYTHSENTKWQNGDREYPVWKVTNPDDFESLSLSPSVDCAKDANGQPIRTLCSIAAGTAGYRTAR